MEAVNDKLHDLALSFTTGGGAVAHRTLLRYFGSAQAVLKAPEGLLSSVAGIGSKTVAAIRNDQVQAYERAEREMRFAKKHAIQILTPNDKGYPRRLEECDDAPSVLYYRGNADLNAQRIVSVVGTRRATEYGKNACRELLAALLAYDVLVVSGLAHGVDRHAHQGSVDLGIPTVGVLAHGLDRIHPVANRNLAEEMLKQGGLLSEFSSDTVPDRLNFSQRNRIIAGLADVLIVVESALTDSAMITADLANGYHRDVCAFPGNAYQPYSAGCNFLIKSHRAHLISRAKDLAYLMNWDPIVS